MLTMVGIGRFADFGEHTIPHQCTAADHVNTTRVNGFIGQALFARHLKELVIDRISVFQRAAGTIHRGMVVFGQSHGQSGHGSHCARHADDSAGFTCRNRFERFIDMLVDVGNGLLNLCFGRRIVLQVAFGHTHRANVHGERGLHLRVRMAYTIAAKHQFRRAATQINHQIRSFDVATNHARGTKEA